MQKTKIVKFIGGMGNQMFQYAFGKALEHKTGAKVLFDISSYKKNKKNIVKGTDKYKNGLSVRQYEINIFKNADITLAGKPETLFIKILNLIGLSKKFKDKTPFKYSQDVFNDKYRYYTGYYQNEKYFKEIRQSLLKDFSLPPLKENDEYNKNLLKQIEDTENSVFIHVRRGDYINAGYLIPDEYYKKAVCYIKEHVEDPVFFVFCAEDTEYIKNKFDIGCKFKLIGEKNQTRENFYENMRLMKACKHGIIANSSYSWWAAWLNEYKEKIIVAPSPWLGDSDDIICEDWVKIKT